MIMLNLTDISLALAVHDIDSDVVESEVDDLWLVEHESPTGGRFGVTVEGDTWSLWWNGGDPEGDGYEGQWEGQDVSDLVNICRGLLGSDPLDYEDAWAIKRPMMELAVTV